jgi:hypothetical protein
LKMVKNLRVISKEEFKIEVEIIPKLWLILWCKNIIFVQSNILKNKSISFFNPQRLHIKIQTLNPIP